MIELHFIRSKIPDNGRFNITPQGDINPTEDNSSHI